jgi:ubiquinone/menaquinone biosynthesis C-methylase UbiE
MTQDSEYLKALQLDAAQAQAYYRKSALTKTRQQERLEQLLAACRIEPREIADVACGAGGTSAHLGAMYPRASYTLIDLNTDALAMAREYTAGLNARYLVEDIYSLSAADDSFDLVVCWQTLSWLDDAGRAVSELVRICKPGGRVFASSLFNVDADVDVYSRVIDHTRPSSQANLTVPYNTYSALTVERWLAGRVAGWQLHDFDIGLDLPRTGRGLGTHTVATADGGRLQISGGMLLNWKILELRK